ncbi:NADH-quinone oxidoreductase subunit NuoN [Pontixanthobacter aestiaquae]|uniref:NADH-quinone oxidoreductase subunit N n=1 Tax=Pontixanthobacter aestiaquae TaxID=1509367 RepID=A0A844Z9J6_9SPHN|nr:NADH-quinone oxidoreductase subunit NuoN [Pontixanthobacter aestiaquae]MDN3645326.1 NADH-quinone oxidoreductase subunit NuoN [Pontixanthobacter aestiaquae]MXO83673.1 NADH-quinone oxidoreductase subunit NuoN [Pontixanthobacter aestiaquae]
MDFLLSFQLSAPEIILSVAGLALLMVAAFAGNKSAKTVTYLAIAALVAASAVVIELFTNEALSLGADAWSGLYRMDAFSNFTKLLIYLATIGCLIVTPKFFDAKGEYRPEYPVLMIFGAVGMGIMVSAVDLMTLYIGLEMSSLSSYVLASYSRSDERSAEAGLKYFVLGALASGILLYGMSLVYGFTGSTSYLGIRAALADGMGTGALFGVVFVLAGLAFKIAAVPFHMWTPDVYEGAPTPVTAFFATAPKVAAVAILMRIALDPFGAQSTAWQQIIIFAALASIVVGALGAIGQENIKRLLAYSSINNVGFILIGLAVATEAGASAMLVYLAIYVFMALGSFVALLMLRDRDGNQLETFADISGLSSTRPMLALCILLLMFSLAGIPPLLGFWGKFVIFQAAVEADLILLATLGIAASVIGAFYYIKFIKVMYFDEPADVVVESNSPARWAVLSLATLVISPLGYLLTIWLGQLADRAASAMFFVI